MFLFIILLLLKELEGPQATLEGLKISQIKILGSEVLCSVVGHITKFELGGVLYVSNVEIDYITVSKLRQRVIHGSQTVNSSSKTN